MNRTEAIRDPAYLHTPTAAAIVPLLQAVITGVILGAAALALAGLLHWRNPWTWAGCVCILSMAAAWISAQRRWSALILPPAGPSPAEDRPAPPAKQQEVFFRLASEVDGTYHETRGVLPATYEQMEALASGLLDGTPLAEREWTGAGRPFSVNGFRELRSELVQRGLLAAANPKDARQGYVLTCVGRQAMRAFLPGELPSPIPPAARVH